MDDVESVPATPLPPSEDERPPPTFRVVVCDDDPVVRSVISELVEERGGEILAETESSTDAIALSDRFAPDLVVLDLGLEIGSGADVLQHLADQPGAPAVVVFTAFDGDVDAPSAAAVVRKPGFQQLERALDEVIRIRVHRQERRRPTRSLPPPVGRDGLGLDDTGAFYDVLLEAEPDDVLLAVPTDDLDLARVAAAMRRVLRGGDRLTQRRGWLVALLVGGGDAGPPSVADRLDAAVPGLRERMRSSPVGDAPSEAFVDLTAGPG